MGLRVPQWVANLFADKTPAVEQPPPIRINPATNLPTVSSTVDHHTWIAQHRPPAIDRASQDTWQARDPGPSRAEVEAAERGHPAGSTFRTRAQRRDDRRAQRGYGAEHRGRPQQPVLWRPAPGLDRDHRDDRPAPWLSSLLGGGSHDRGGGNDLGHPPGCGCHWCGG